MPIRISRQDHWAARSTPKGTRAGLRLEGPVATGPTSVRRSARMVAHWWASRWVSRSRARLSAGVSGGASLLTDVTLGCVSPNGESCPQPVEAGTSPDTRAAAASGWAGARSPAAART